MTEQAFVIVPPSLVRLLGNWAVSTLLMIGGLWGVSVGLLGLTWPTLALMSAAIAGLATAIFVIAIVRQRPQVVITPDGFTFCSLIGNRSYKWQDIEGQFGVFKLGLNKLVGFRWTADFKARTGKKPSTSLSGYDDALGGALALSAQELTALLNEKKRTALLDS